MARAKRLTRPAVAAALGLVLLSGCGDQSNAGPTEPTPDWSDGVNPNCSGGRPLVRYERFDINDDGAPDWFYVFRCPEAADKGRGDQLESLDGRADLSRPRPLGRHPAIHSDAGVHVLEGCLVFTHQRVLVADRVGRVVRIGTWQKNGVTMAKPGRAETVPCQEARWENSG